MYMYDVTIVGAGPAGLSAALILGRYRRRVLVCDAGEHRNADSHALHGFLTRDGIEPGELLRQGREQLRQYEGVELREIAVVDAARGNNHFEVVLQDGARITSRKLLLTTGVVDELPPIEGLKELYGRSVFHCPYCDGWEVRDQPLAVYATQKRGRKLALELTPLSHDIVLCTDGQTGLDEKDRKRLARHDIAIREERIVRLEGRDGMLKRIIFADGKALPRRALFFRVGERQRSDLATRLGCTFTNRGAVRTNEYESTNVPGLYVAGDAARRVQLAIVAASEGAEAAFAINTVLLKEDMT